MSELKPCPFCGETPEIEAKPLWEISKGGVVHGYVNHYKYDICCLKCGCNVHVKNNTSIYVGRKKARENAIKAWNCRAEQGQTAEVAKLKRELERVKQERDAAVEDMQEIMALTSEMRVCTKYCVSGHCYNRGGNMPCSPRWDASWSGHKMEG